ncbi:hypothetical protein Y900_026330 [Mycolicibacterium aromaticivorans JS19b1 = JCM 16368]|uniref:Uncharacterized protein n=1 Tax=Mycolicibacterium aromaticivorans JS19b1 = JCM 16368 TaxID=1440774 RepID=A0A064CUI9_9MYCO|nr:hypothetical protein [Mycolicibacterium aromaticivorans]KDF02359.1 hypothetical protein Y900_026330 [Mycolicibacterium aromaticivorans JS19b1 = JCM 16368]
MGSGAGGVKSTVVVDKHPKMLVWAAIGLVVVAAGCHLFVSLALYPTAVYWMTYYVPNYAFGFVRRGLGGEIIHLLPDADYFPAAYTMMWAPVVVWLAALGGLVWLILSSGEKTPRRVMLALLVPVLPFALSYALYTPRPELYAMSALVVLGIALTRLQSDRAVLMASIVYGVTIAVLALVHEGIPLEVALGGALAISILPAHLAPGRRRLCAVAALGPGLAAIATIAAFSRNDVGTRLCEQIPHRQLDEPFPSDPMAYLAGRTPTKTDFHSWVCNFERTIVDARVTDGLHKVGTFGAGPLLASFAVGVLYFVVSLWATKSFSGLRVSALLHEVRGKLTAPLLGLAAMVPLFMTAVDWTRWWVLITFNVVLICVLYTTSRPEIDQPTTQRHLRIFLCVIAVFAVIPTGAALHIGGPNF